MLNNWKLENSDNHRHYKKLGNRQADAILVRMRMLSFVFSAVLIAISSVQAEPETIAARDATVDNVQLHYLTTGHGPTVILLHGFAETSRMWRPIIPMLAERFTVTTMTRASVRVPRAMRNGLSNGQTSSLTLNSKLRVLIQRSQTLK